MRNIDDLREALFDTIDGLKKGTIDVSQAKAIGDLSQVIINTAKVEVDYIKTTGTSESNFIEQKESLPDGVTSIRRHAIR